MNWRTALIIIVGIWVVGWLAMSAFVVVKTASIQRRGGDAGTARAWGGGGVFAFILSFFLFPIVCLRLLGDFAPRLGVLLRLRPGWSIRTQGEEQSHTWFLKDGRELSAQVFGFLESVTASIIVYCAVEAVSYRVSKVAPEPGPSAEWQVMRRLPSNEMPPDAGRNQNVFDAEPKLERGKYLVSFRVLGRSDEPEEFSGLTLIIR